MSGGADSTLAAVLLKEQGWDVTGITMQLLPREETDEAVESSRKIAHQIGITHMVIDFSNIFSERVVSPFCQEYTLGHTPNPCVLCNEYIKFGILREKVLQQGADYLATGHYARIERSEVGYNLLKGADSSKDQSYFLYRLSQKELQRVIFPVGEWRKTDVKNKLVELGLLPDIRKESQDICFIPSGGYRTFITERVTLRPGEIVDTTGEVIGKHSGLANYTVGQRAGLGGSKNRLYVVRLDTALNRVVVGPEEELFRTGLAAGRLSWISGKAPEGSVTVTAIVRYKAPEVSATLILKGDIAEVRVQNPQKAIAPGQSIVFYQGEKVLGGGIIK